MVKHSKKKRPEKKPDSPDDSKNDPPPTDPATSPAEQIIAKKFLDKLFWLRVVLAVLGGIISEIALESIEGEERRWASIAILIIIYIISFMIAKGMRIPIPRSDRKKLVTTGIGSYVFIFLFTWILIHTVVVALAESTSLPFT